MNEALVKTRKLTIEQRLGDLRSWLVNRRCESKDDAIRVKKDLAEYILIINFSVIIKGKVEYVDIKPLGLGVYRIKTNMQNQTRMIGKNCA